MKKPNVTAAVATAALCVASLSVAGGWLEQNAATREVCQSRIETNAAVRGLLHDFFVFGKTPLVEMQAAEGIALKRFPDHC